ncbi:hypothetical protein BWI17_06410 [Betaproteobacteria bacterium GR16-43]|nr:hypothetical protein BWI17_06410 [Betaproteobacteria bacterium GR16-43]
MSHTTPPLHDPDATLPQTLAALATREGATRRRLLRGLGIAVAGAFAAAPLRSMAACTVIPTETGGPFPGDGTNGPNVLTASGIVRSDIRGSFGSAGTAVAPGTPLTVTLTLVNTNDNCAPLAGYAIYIWHCNATGGYSMYSSGVTTQNYLRGVQVTDAQGKVTFTTIFPGAYSGRWPHIHFEIYTSTAAAVSGANALRTSQLALPEAQCREVYTQTALYPGSLANMNQTTLANDGVFSDDRAVNQLAATTGSLSAGYSAALQVGIATTPAVAPSLDQFGLSGMWYEPASSGQGLALEVMADAHGTGVGFLQGGWFTYDVAPAGGIEKQRWYTFGGDVLAGASSATLPLYANTGGNFAALPVTTAVRVGTATVSFSSCNAGQFSYTLSDGRTGTIPLSRLLASPTCSTTTSRPTNADFSLSGNWYDPARSGQGFIVEVNPNVPVTFFCWYTYAANGELQGVAGQRWFTGQGAYAAGSKTMTIPLYETQGGVFDTDTPASQATSVVGTATLTFQSCINASLAYSFTAGSNAGRSGNIALSRLGPMPAGCTA